METKRTATAGNQTDETDDARESDSFLLTEHPEIINKGRDCEQNSSVLDAEKNKNNENTKSYSLKPDKKRGIKSVKFNPPASKFEKWCSEKTGLSRVGLLTVGGLLLLLFILFLTVLIMSCLWPNIPHSLMFPMCRSPACLLASSEVLSKMNQSVNPCQDIKEYSCGKWFSSNTIPKDKSSWNMKELMQFKHKEEIRDMITTMPQPNDVEQFQWRLKSIYDSCMSVGSVETEDSRPLKKVISLLGGWHVLRDFSIQTWDMKKTLWSLHAKYNIQPFFFVGVVPDAKSPTQSIIQISPGSLGLPDRSYYFRRSDDKVIKAYKIFVKDVVQILGATSTDAETFADDIFGFERRLAERFPSRLPDRIAHYRPTIYKLEVIAPSVPFFDILTHMFPDAKLTKRSEVLVIASDHLVNVSHIISNTDSSALNNYMIWRLTVGYLPYLSKKYRNTLNEFYGHLYGSKEVIPRWEMCIETLQKYVGYGMEAMAENSISDAEQKRKVVNEIFESIRKVIKQAVLTSNTISPHIKEHFLDKLNNVGIEVGLPVSMRHASYYNDFYRSLTSIKDDFFQNILYSVTFILEEQQKRLINPSEEHRWMDFVTDGKLKVVYVPEINKVVVPLTLLALPYFHTQFPLPILYGGIGVELGLALMGAVSGRGMFHAGDGALLPPDHPAANGSHDCFLTDTKPPADAIRHTFAALNSIIMNLPHMHQPALEYLEDQHIFYISYAQSICTMKTQERQDLDYTTLKSKLDDISMYSVPDTPIAVDSSITAKELNSLLFQLLNESAVEDKIKKIDFDFLAGDQFIRTELGEHISTRGLSSESVIEVEYVKRLPAPEPQDCLLHDDWVASVHICDEWILTGCYDDTLHLWTLKGKHKLTIPGHEKAVKAVSWITTQDNIATFVSGSQDQNALLWQWNMEKNLVECVHVCRGHGRGIECVGVNTDETKFATGAWDNMLKIWSTSMDENYVNEKDGESDSKRAKKDGKSQIRTPEMTLKGHREAISSLTWLSSSELVTACWDHTLRLWDVSAGASVSQISGNKAFFDVHCSSFNNLLVTASADRHVRLYDPRSQEGGICKATLTSHDGWVMTVRWSPTNERLLISGGNDSKLKLWDIRSPSVPLFDMTGHEDKILCSDWTLPNLIVSGGADNSLHIFKAGNFI